MSSLINNPDRTTQHILHKRFDTTLNDSYGVYAFISCNIILYIGSSTAVHKRINSHINSKRIAHFINDEDEHFVVHIKYCKDRKTARLIEKRLIKRYNPVMNKQYNDTQTFRMMHETMLSK